jgi:hypothetical protein
MLRAIMRNTILILALALSACGGGGGVSVAPPTTGDAPAPVTDDTAAVQAMVDKGGTVAFAAKTYHLSKTITVTKSGTVIEGVTGTVFDYVPTTTEHCVTDRVFTTPCAFDDAPPRQVAAPIAVGDTSFTATDAADVADLAPGEWILINDYDSVIGDRVAVDWEQVQSVDGLTVNVKAPFRMSFTTARPWVAGKSGLGFTPITPLAENITLRNFSVTVEPVPGEAAVGISLFGVLNATVDNVSVTDPAAQPLYTYLSEGVTIMNSQTAGGTVLSEFAASVDVTISNNRFSSSAAPAFGLDLGLGFFEVTDNMVEQSENNGFYLLYGVHDGAVTSNSVAYVDSSAGFNATGILLRGSQNIAVTGNSLAGGAGNASVGISVGTYMGEILEPDTGDTVAGNTITGFITAIED